MSIKRAPRPESNFYLLDKRIADDKRLSWAARGLLIYLLGKPDHWQVSVAHLRNETSASAKPTGRDGVYSLLNELIAAGYVTRAQGRSDSGQMAEAEYIVSESPVPPEPLTEKPDTAQPVTANPTQVSIDVQQGLIEASTEHTKPSSAKKPKAENASDGFDAAWKAYPKRAGSNPRDRAKKAWDARVKEGVKPEDMMAGVIRYAGYCAAKGSAGTEYVMQAQRFFGPSREFDGEWSASVTKSRHVGLNNIDHTVGLIDNGDGTYDF